MSNTISSWFIPFFYTAASGETTTPELIEKQCKELKANNEEPSFPKILTPAQAAGGGIGVLGILVAAYGFLKENSLGKIFGIGATILGIVGYFADKFFVKGSSNNNGGVLLDEAVLTKKLESFRTHRKQAIDYVGRDRLANFAKKYSIISLDKKVFVIPDEFFSNLFEGRVDALVVADKHQFIKFPDEQIQRFKSNGYTDEDINDCTAFLNFLMVPGHAVYPQKLFDKSAPWGEEISLSIVTHEMYEQIWYQKTYNESGIDGRKQVAQLTRTFNSIVSNSLISDFVENLTEGAGQYEKDSKENNFAHEFWAQLDCPSCAPEIRDKVKLYLQEVRELIEREHPEAMKIHREILAEAKKRARKLYDDFQNGRHMNWDEVLKD
ncbi:MAG: hypothetical protein HY094_04100 [Candidatus Melainabacteria bacterium]|nr:hypothetical protein [Candidatus Melainabacteria bacterium]